MTNHYTAISLALVGLTGVAITMLFPVGINLWYRVNSMHPRYHRGVGRE
jgi:hypothetical protein